MKRNIFIGLFILFSVGLLSQSKTAYTVGVNSLGNYGLKVDRGDSLSFFSFSYTSFNFNNTFNSKGFSMNAPSLGNSYMFDVAYFRNKDLSKRLTFVYGGGISLVSFPNITSSSVVVKNGGYKPNFDLNLGLVYKISDKVSVSASFNQRYGYSPYFYDNSLFGNSFLSPFHNAGFNSFHNSPFDPF